jgi:FMN phosphatase YigB (HAD superfamily)
MLVLKIDFFLTYGKIYHNSFTMITRSQARKKNEAVETTIKFKEEIEIIEYVTYDKDLEYYFDIASVKLQRIIKWLREPGNIDDKLDILEKVDEIYELYDRMAYLNIIRNI